MSRVVVLRHRGVLCAVPAAQVLAVQVERGDAEPLQLWAESDGSTAARCIRVQVGGVDRTLECSEPHLFELAGSGVFALPPLLERALGKPFLAGLARIDGEWAWLVDLRQAVAEET